MSTGKRGKKEKNKFCYTKDLSATGPLPTSFPGFYPTRSTERERAGRRKPWERGWTFGPLLGNLAVVPFAVGSTAIVDSRSLFGSARFSKSDQKVNNKITIESYPE